MKLTPTIAAALAAGVFLLGAACAAEAPADGKFLAERHVAKGMKCETCHSDVATGKIILDEKRHEVCVSCHGWYDHLVKLTPPKSEEDQNPHGHYDGNLPCTE